MEEEKDSDVVIGYVQESFDICRIWLSSILNHKQNSNFLIMCTVPFILILALQSELCNSLWKKIAQLKIYILSE